MRQDALTWEQLTTKKREMEKRLGATVIFDIGTANPVFLCDQGARRRNLDLEVSAADAANWAKTGSVPLRATPVLNDDERKVEGAVEYVLLVVSHPTWRPTAPQLGEFVNDQLPELGSSTSAKIGFLVKTCALTSESMGDWAIEAFGSDFSDSGKYTYRTIHFSISGGEAKILVAYVKASGGPTKLRWQFWK